MIIKGRAISTGKAEGEVVKLDEAFSFLGGVNATTGDLNISHGNIAGKVFVFPQGKGSTVGSFVMYDLMVHGKAPAALINESAETIVTTGAVISSIPMVDSISVDIFRDEDRVVVDGDNGTVEIRDVNVIRVVSSAIYRDGKVLMLKRPDSARSFPGIWSLVAGKIEKGESTEAAAKREIMEETRISVPAPAASLKPVYVREKDTIWEVHPFLFKVKEAEPVLNKENVDYKWVTLEEMKEGANVPLTYKVVYEMLKM